MNDYILFSKDSLIRDEVMVDGDGDIEITLDTNEGDACVYFTIKEMEAIVREAKEHSEAYDKQEILK